MRVPVGANDSIAFTVSIGIAVPSNDDIFDLLRRVDDALYVAKSNGRNQAVLAA
jgi:PleD family two-component response regulator